MRTIVAAILSLAAVAAAARAQAPSPSPKAPSPPPASPAPSASPGPSFPAAVELVTVDVVVTDKKGKPITGLTKDDFRVVEEGAAQAITSFEAVTVPATPSDTAPARPRIASNMAKDIRTGRSFVILFDDIHLTPMQAHRAKSAVAQFLRTGVREADRVTLVAAGGGAWWSTRMEAGREELITMVKRLDGRHIPDMSPERMTDYEAMRIHVYHDAQVEQRVTRRFETFGVSQRMSAGRSEVESYAGEGDPFVRARATDVYFQSVQRNRITLAVLQRVIQSLASTKGRKSVVLVSEGFIYDPNLDEFKAVIQASRRSNAAIYFVDTRGLSGMHTYASAEFGPPLDERDIGAAFTDQLNEGEGSESLASDSGGFTVKNTNDLGKGIQRIADETQAYYLIGYNPTNTARDGRFRKIEVKLPARKGINVRARRGYFAPLESGKRAEKVSGPDPDIQAALDSPYDAQEVPLRMTAYVYDETLLGKASTLVATEVDVAKFAFEEQGGRFMDTLEFLLVVAHRESGEFYRYDQKIEMKLQASTRERITKTGFPVVRDFELAPGGYQAKIVVRDKNSGRIGTVVHEFEVPDLSQFRVSTPMITDTLQADPEQKAPPRPALVVRRTFAPGAMLYAQFEVYGATRDNATSMPRVSAGYELRRPDGTVVAQVPASRITPTSLGKLARVIGHVLPADAAGDFELVLSFKDEISGKAIELREPFTVDPAPTAAATAGS